MAEVVDQVPSNAASADPGMDERVARLAGARNAADAAIVEFVAERFEADDWHGDGIKSLEHFCSWQFGLTLSRASATTAVARRRSELTETFDKFQTGALSFEQVSLIARHCPADYEQSVSEFAVAATLPQLSRTLRAYAWPDSRPEKPMPHHAKRASFCTDDRGDFRLVVTGDSEEGARVAEALNQYWYRVRDGRDPADSSEVTNHEAFMTLIDSAADADVSTSRRNRHKALIHIEASDFVGAADSPNEFSGRFHLGPLLDEATTRLVTCDAAVQAVINDYGSPVRLGRSSRTVPDSVRALIVNRDGGCRFCGATVGLDIHHIIHWADGGPTDPANLVTLCGRHHTLLHRGEFTIRGNPEIEPSPHNTCHGMADGLTFHDGNGKPLAPPRPRCPSAPPTGWYHHPLGERLDRRAIWFNPN